MNNLVILSTKAERNKPKEESSSTVKPKKLDKAAYERGAPMQSRIGVSTKQHFTCFFRGSKGETGGKKFQENSESTVKKLKQVGEQNKSDVVNKPVKTSDVRDFIQFDRVKKEQRTKQKNEAKKATDSQQMMRTTTKLASTLNSDQTANFNSIDSLSPRNRRKKSQTINLYEKIATEMRSKAVREEIKFTLKQTPTAQMAAKKNDFSQKPAQGRAQPVSTTIKAQDAKALQKIAMGRVLPSGHELWAQPVSYAEGPSQWESAISRQTAQYHLVEKHAREVDCVHEISYNRTQQRARVTHFDDQVYQEVKKKKPHVPTCLQGMPMCSFRNRDYQRRLAEAQKIENCPEKQQPPSSQGNNGGAEAAALSATQQQEVPEKKQSVSTNAPRKKYSRGYTEEQPLSRKLTGLRQGANKLSSTMVSPPKSALKLVRKQVKKQPTAELVANGRGSNMESRQDSPMRNSSQAAQVLNVTYALDQVPESSEFSTFGKALDASISLQQHQTPTQVVKQNTMTAVRQDRRNTFNSKTANKHKRHFSIAVPQRKHPSMIEQQPLVEIGSPIGLRMSIAERSSMTTPDNLEPVMSQTRNDSPTKQTTRGGKIGARMGVSNGTGMTRQNFHIGSKNFELDVPDYEPEDAKLAYNRFMTKVKTPIQERQLSRSMLLNDAIGNLNESRFVPFKDISDWNGKYKSNIAQPWIMTKRETEIPGTVKNKSLQKNGPDFDMFIDCNPHVGKKSLHLGMVELDKQFNHRESLSKTNQVPGRNNWKGVGTTSDPWEYDPNSLWHATQKLSNFSNKQSFVQTWDKQLPRTTYGSIYCKRGEASAQDPLLPSAKEEESMRVRQCASEATHHRKQAIRSHKSFNKSANQSKLGQEESPQVSKVSFMDFLPNSIVRSPQRSGTSHTMTTQRLGLTKVNRIGAFMQSCSESESIDGSRTGQHPRTTKSGTTKFTFPGGSRQSKIMENAHTTAGSFRSSTRQPTTACTVGAKLK